MVLDVCNDGDCRAAVCCWPCFWSFDPDAYILPEHWRAADPVVAFEQLPPYETEDVAHYDFVWTVAKREPPL